MKKFMKNWYYPKVLCVCSANQLRSPTMAWMVSNPPYSCDTRSCGTDCDSYYGGIAITDTAVLWSDIILCADRGHLFNVDQRIIKIVGASSGVYTKSHLPLIICLDIPDEYNYRDSKLVSLIRLQLNRGPFKQFIRCVKKRCVV